MNSKNKTVTFILDLTQEGIIMVILHMACVGQSLFGQNNLKKFKTSFK
jgi:hypothetical protein